MPKLLRKTRSHGKYGACLKNCVAGETRLKLVVRIGGIEPPIPEDHEVTGIYQEHNSEWVLLRYSADDSGGWPQKSIQSMEVIS